MCVCVCVVSVVCSKLLGISSVPVLSQYMTSQACSRCQEQRVTFYKRRAWCQGCGPKHGFVDRDLGGAANIRFVLLCIAARKPLPALMCRKQANPTHQH